MAKILMENRGTASRISQELPGANWLEEKIRNKGLVKSGNNNETPGRKTLRPSQRPDPKDISEAQKVSKGPDKSLESSCPSPPSSPPTPVPLNRALSSERSDSGSSSTADRSGLKMTSQNLAQAKVNVKGMENNLY